MPERSCIDRRRGAAAPRWPAGARAGRRRGGGRAPYVARLWRRRPCVIRRRPRGVTPATYFARPMLDCTSIPRVPARPPAGPATSTVSPLVARFQNKNTAPWVEKPQTSTVLDRPRSPARPAAAATAARMLERLRRTVRALPFRVAALRGRADTRRLGRTRRRWTMRAPARPTHPTTTFTSADAAAAPGRDTHDAPRISRYTVERVSGAVLSPSRQARRGRLRRHARGAGVRARPGAGADRSTDPLRRAAGDRIQLPAGERPDRPARRPIPRRPGRRKRLRVLRDPRRANSGSSVCSLPRQAVIGGISTRRRSRPADYASNPGRIRPSSEACRPSAHQYLDQARTRWVDGRASVSDVAMQSNTTTNVYTTGVLTDAVRPDGPRGPWLATRPRVSFNGSAWRNGSDTGMATRWVVGGGAAPSSIRASTCTRTIHNLVYYSEPLQQQHRRVEHDDQQIRRWNLTHSRCHGTAAAGYRRQGQGLGGDRDRTSGALGPLDSRLDNVHVTQHPACAFSTVSPASTRMP